MDIVSLRTLEVDDLTIRPSSWLRWPATTTSSLASDRHGSIDVYIAAGRSARVLIEAKGRSLIISPADPEGFQQAYREASLLGALQSIEAISQRPRFALTRLLADRAGLILVSLGIILPVILLGYLTLRVPNLPLEVPFGFDAQGFPQTYAPPGRLLLLPLISGFCWAVNLVVGLWLYRSQSNQPLAYSLWATSVVVSGLFWGATLQLLAA
jgi:phosphate/sulfate permease